MKQSPPDIVTEITNSAENRIITVGTVHDETQQDLNAEANLTFDGSTLALTGDLTVSGNTTISGTTTSIQTTNTVIKDAIIELNNGATTGNDSAIIVERGSTGNNAAIIWDESRDEFVIATTTATGASTGDLSFTPANLSVERIGAGTEQAEAEVHAKRDASANGVYSTTAPIIIEDDARPAIQFVGSANNIALIQFGDNAAAASGQLYYDHSTDKLRVDCGGSTDRLTVDASGNAVTAGTVTATGFTIGSAAITETELEILDGATVSTTELNILAGKSFVDEDDMSSNSATAIASQQSIKAYVDAQVTAQDLDATTDSGTIAIDLDSETLTIAGGEGIDTSASSNTITIACEDSTANNKGAVIVAGGTGASVAYSSGTATVSVDASQTQITTIGAAGATTNIAAGDLTMYNAVNDGNPTISLGSASAERLIVTANYASGAQTLESVEFSTATSSGTADHGKFVFDVDGTDILTIDDGGINLTASKALEVNGTAILSDSSGTMTLSNVDALDATTEATIEAAIDTLTSPIVVSGTNPTLTIGDGGTEDTMVAFNGATVDFSIGIDDSADALLIGKGTTHGAQGTTAIKIDQNVNVQITHNSAVADGEVSGDLAVFQAGEDLSAGEIVAFNNNGRIVKAVATAAATSRAIGLVVEDISNNAFGPVLLRGFARFNTAFPTYTVGGSLYNPTAEQSNLNVPHQTAPSADGQFLQIVGFAVSADAIFFDPDSTVVEIA